MTLVEFNSSTNISDWFIVNDVIMGGKSNSDFYLNKEGNAIFKGFVSLENNGGFSMSKHPFEQTSIHQFSKIVLKLKGDGKRYQFRVKSNASDAHSYVSYFETNGEWQLIEIFLSQLVPTFRGQTLDKPNYPAKVLQEIALLIGNQKAESFQLEIKSIVLK
ncbi:CIA30 family protein [Labilibaculum sp.]|uniref:CIA30 family protein n=1 Tax=Labilibaculum sp. TaxID=2060723 RepID=UPI003568E0C6